MKALVLAGGSGTRLRPFTYSIPKQLMPLANRPTIAYVLDNVRSLGVTEVGIVVGDQASAVVDAVGDGGQFGLHVTYVRQDRPAGLAHAVRVARPFLADDDFVMLLGDNVLADGVVDVGDRFRQRRPAAQLVLHKVLDPRPFGVAELRPDGTLRRLVEKPRRPRSNLASVGVYFFTAAIYAAVDAIGPSARGELEISHAIQWLVDRGVAVDTVEYCGYWKDVGTVEDALHCNRHLLGRLHPAAAAGAVDAASRVDAQVVVESGARIVRSTVTGPTIVGAGAILEDCRIGPYTSIGRDCVVRACGVRDSILLEGAHVTAVDDLASSIVGRGAVVSRRDRPDGLRLIVGDHTQVDLAR